MNHLIVGLGNPGDEYLNTRHNAGRIVLGELNVRHEFSGFENDKKAKGLIAKGAIAGKKAVVLFPETFMNNSGESVRTFVKSAKDAEKVIVVYDDLDLPMGSYKVSYDRSSGGHNGVQSVIDHLKTQQFVRVRVGISPVSASGVVKKPKGEAAVQKFILGAFTKSELETLKKLSKEIADAIECVVKEGHVKAMSQYN